MESTSIIEEAIGTDIELDSSDIGSIEEEYYDKTFSDSPGQGNAKVMTHFYEAGGTNDTPYIPPENYNYSIPDYQSTNEDTHNFLEEFIPNTAPEKYSMHTQVGLG